MLMIIFEVTDANEIIGFSPKTLEIWKKVLNQVDADIYRQRMYKEIMPRDYFNQIPGKVIGILSVVNPLSPNSTI